MEKVRYGIVGVGNQGTYYANLFNKGDIPNGELVAICDTNDVKIDALLKKISLKPLVFKSYMEMLDAKCIDALIITVPHYIHPDIAIECFKRNIHVMCDKPAGVYTKQVRVMNDKSLETKSYFGLMFNQRTNCVYRKMKEIIASGELGELQRVNWIITDWFRTKAYYDSGSWRATWKGEGGGVLINQCPHQIDLISWVLGEMPISVNAFCQYGKWHDIEVEDEVTAFFKYKNGATGVFVTTTGETPGTNRFEVSGTKGKLLCENNKLYFYKNEEDSIKWSNNAKGSFDKPKVTIIEPETDGENLQHKKILCNFTNTILGKEKLFVDGKEGINGVELMNAIELSGWLNGQTVNIPVDEDRYLEELNKRIKTSRLKVSNDNSIEESLNFGTGFDHVKNGK